MELALPHMVFDPVETHVVIFGDFMLDVFICGAASGGVVFLGSSCRLLVAHFL